MPPTSSIASTQVAKSQAIRERAQSLITAAQTNVSKMEEWLESRGTSQQPRDKVVNLYRSNLNHLWQDIENTPGVKGTEELSRDDITRISER